MKKLLLLSCLAFCISFGFLCNSSYAKVDYMEVLSIGTSTAASLAVGSSTVLADTTRAYDKADYFEAQIQYQNTVTAVPMRWTITTIDPTVTQGSVLYDGDILVLQSLADMQSFKACAGTTTAASYGTATVTYSKSYKQGITPKTTYMP